MLLFKKLFIKLTHFLISLYPNKKYLLSVENDIQINPPHR